MEFYPDLLTFADGTPVTAENAMQRRIEMIDILSRGEYGFIPDPPESITVSEKSRDANFFAGHATRTYLEIGFDAPGGHFSFPVKLFTPNDRRRSPVFAFINFRDGDCDEYFPTEEIIDRGFAAAMVCYKDLTSDGPELDGVAALYPRRNDGTDPGKISFWAFGLSRVVDMLFEREEIDMRRIGVIGHSRLGKTALWCAANDGRVNFAVSNDSGCSGAAYERVKHEGSETLDAIVNVFPYWFCDNFRKYVGDPDSRDFDQHFLLASIAPRRLLIGSAASDLWADPQSEQLCALAASPMWEIYGGEGLVGGEEPVPVGTSLNKGNIHYHLREGTHFLSRRDWNEYMNFFVRTACFGEIPPKYLKLIEL